MSTTIEQPIYVAGHRGMVGSAVVRQLEALGYADLILRTRKHLDLRDQTATKQFFATYKPATIILRLFLSCIEINTWQSFHGRLSSKPILNTCLPSLPWVMVETNLALAKRGEPSSPVINSVSYEINGFVSKNLFKIGNHLSNIAASNF